MTKKVNNNHLPPIKGYCKDCIYFNKDKMCERFSKDPSLYTVKTLWMYGSVISMFETKESGYCNHFKSNEKYNGQ